MLDIRVGLDWLLSEIKSGIPLTEKDHGWTIRNVGALHLALEKKERDYLAKAGFNPNQPRVPAGSPEGGEWTDGGGGTTQSTSQKPRRGIIGELFGVRPAYGGELPKPFNSRTAIIHAADNIVDPVTHPHGDGKCARKVREAIEAGGIPIPKSLWKGSAKDYGSTLENEKVGFRAEIQVPSGEGYPPKGYSPKVGDVAVIQSTSASKHGHMAIYAGEETYTENGKSKTRELWISDFVQKRGAYPGPSYRTEKPSYVIYRHPDIAD